MKKSTLKSLVAYLNGETVANINEIKAELQAELSKGEEKAKANRDLYAAAHEAVMGVMNDTPMTVADIFAACEDKLPENFTKAKVQYALLHYWNDEVVKVENGRSAYQYRLV